MQFWAHGLLLLGEKQHPGEMDVAEQTLGKDDIKMP